MPAEAALVTGATSLVGRFLIPRLEAAGVPVVAWSRGSAPGWAAGRRLTWETTDISRPLEVARDGPSLTRLFHLAPLWLLPPMVAPLAERGLRRVVAFGSTSRFTKEASGTSREREVARRLAEAEERLRAECRGPGIAWTVFRPTLTYDGAHDGNVTAIARFVKRFGFFPVIAPASGRRQPVHADDLATACVLAEKTPAAYSRAYDLPGGTTLSYRELVEEVCRGLGRRPRIVSVPAPLLRAALAAAARLPGLAHLSPDMADRMNKDLCFDSAAARRDFGYAPRPFTFREAP